MRRMMLGMSQEKLGDALGLTFQQVQKYEKGTNRIGASRLQQISQILQVPVAFFFEGAPDTATRCHDGMKRSALAGLCVGLPRDLGGSRADQGVHAHQGAETAPPHRRPGRTDRGRRQVSDCHCGRRSGTSVHGRLDSFALALSQINSAHILTAPGTLQETRPHAAGADPVSSRGECSQVSRANYLFTSESVSEGHPDKVCDQISDAILDAFIANDIKLGIADDSQVNTRLGCETLCTTNKIVIAGEGRGQAPAVQQIRQQGARQSRDDRADRARCRQGHRLRPGRLLLSRRRRRGAAARPVARHRDGRRRQEEEGRTRKKAPATRA